MTAIVRTPECFPENDRFLRSFGNFIGLSAEPIPAPEAHHDACSGGFTMPGVLGGWVCPCECHREATS